MLWPRASYRASSAVGERDSTFWFLLFLCLEPAPMFLGWAPRSSVHFDLTDQHWLGVPSLSLPCLHIRDGKWCWIAARAQQVAVQPPPGVVKWNSTHLGNASSSLLYHSTFFPKVQNYCNIKWDACFEMEQVSHKLLISLRWNTNLKVIKKFHCPRSLRCCLEYFQSPGWRTDITLY